MEERRRGKSTAKLVVVGVAIGVIVAYTILGVWSIYEERNKSKIHLEAAGLLSYYWNDSDRREQLKVTLHNEGHVDGYATVLFYVECNGQIQNGEIKEVFVPAHSYVDVLADLDIPEPPAEYSHRAIILYQWK